MQHILTRIPARVW